MSLYYCSCATVQDRQLKEVKQWGYQLQNYRGEYDYNRIYKSNDMLWVIDAQFGDSILTKSKVETLKTHRNIIISYFSIGEAESYRNYFKTMPKKLLVAKNKDWSGNFRVKYWLPEWHAIMINYLSEILDAGFDGAYLDIVDAFDYYPSPKLKRKRAEQMLALVSSLHDYARKRNPHFRFIQQNGTSIIYLLKNKKKWFDLIDALGIESMFFSGPKKMNNRMHLDQSILKNIKVYQSQNLPIFNIEYIDKVDLLKQYGKLAKIYHVIPLAAEKMLDGPQVFAPYIFGSSIGKHHH